ncbi:mechanosensitive ion channel domain-containing protein [Leptolyngbya sp. FACHB-261]|uniref:mechanosensitive ion channel domain-containing protein n=1 Tax=Leptolyngbya sp. FACHB-261 TaxID=2692806 RepID=UPI00168901EC|nr:mechanosensitive ion channel domain-containing protein [Leptolyngbya sp. FACHB-261]MBD2105139.1 mechanosensitive ion channel [Leptolyngbya sp. FACHB-261]
MAERKRSSPGVGRGLGQALGRPLRRWCRRWWRRWSVVLLGVLTLLLILGSTPGLAQAPSAPPGKAPVVVDGRVLFQVNSSGNLSAAERAESINAALEQLVQESATVDLEVAQESQLTLIRNRTDERLLLTVTEEDVTSGTSPGSQALIWRRSIESALRQGQLERTLVYYRQACLFSAGVLLGAIAVHFSLRFLERWLSRLLVRLWGQSPEPLYPWQQPAKLFLQLGLLGLKFGLWAAVGFYLSDLFPQIRSWRYALFKFLAAPVISLGGGNYSALTLLLLLAFTVGLWFAVSGLTRLFRSYVLSRTGADAAAQEVVAILTQYILTFLGLIVLLQIWGLDVGSLAILASVLGVGLGFGVQNITNNFISGLIIKLERPIQEGDFVKVADLMGTVKHVGARSAEILTLDQVTIIVPNSRFLESEVINWSHGDPVSRLRLPVGVAYGSDVDQVQAALLESAKSHPEVLVKPRPQVWFQSFGDSCLNFELMVWTGDPKNQFRVKSDLYYRIEASLRRYNIEVPFPQRDLHLRSPRLEELIAAWLQQHAPSSQVTSPIEKQLYLPNGSGVTEIPSPPPVQPVQPVPAPQASINLSSVASRPVTPSALNQRLATLDVKALVAAMRGTGGVKIQDRRYRQNLYPACFIGAEAVEWLVQSQDWTREEAIQIGQILVERGIIHHASDDQPFQDGYVFYRFYVDEEG